MPVNRNDYVAWRYNVVTEEFLKDALETCDAMIAYLTQRAGIDPNHDRYLVGKIEGLRSLAEWSPDFDTEEEENA